MFFLLLSVLIYVLLQPIIWEKGTRFLEELCDSPIICEVVITDLIKRIKIMNASLHNVNVMHELLFLFLILENAVNKFSKGCYDSLDGALGEKVTSNYKQKLCIKKLDSTNRQKNIETWKKQLESLVIVNFKQVQFIISKCLRVLDCKSV